jgi:RHS repeat-associated protein
LGKDILGSVRSTTNETGNLEDRYEYDAFGTPYRGSHENGMNLGYTGKAYDAGMGLYNYGYRDYQPGLARFTTVDPIRDGNNWFAYVNNNPVNWIDPWGLSASEPEQNTNIPPSVTPLPAEWINPVDGPISSDYGERNNPITGEQEFHASIDIVVAQGTQVVAAASGTVVIGETPTFGQFAALHPDSTELNPDGNYRVITSHMSQVDVQNGDSVEAGQVIGLSGGAPGTTGAGTSTGPHVDLMVRTDGQNTPSWAGTGQNTIDPTEIFDY